MKFDEIVMSRYAVKSFNGEKIPQEKIDKLLELIRFAPSSANTQPWKILVISDPSMKAELSAAAWNQPQITTCSHLLVFCADTDLTTRVKEIEAHLIDQGSHPDDIKGYLAMIDGMDKGMQGEHRLSFSKAQTFLALGNALNGSKSLGFDSCPMGGFDDKAFSKILKLPDHIVPVALCAIGYANDKPRAKHRLAKKLIFKFI